MTTWFTSDTHFFHKGIISHCNRPYADAEQMNEDIIKTWNQFIGPLDHVYHLGDLSFSGLEKTVSVVGQLNGWLHVVPGNHDNPQMMRHLQELKLIELLPPLYEYKHGDARFVLCHFPLASWNRMHHGSFHLHGHCHGSLKEQRGRRQDVGWDVYNAPVNVEFLSDLLTARPVMQVDHHTEKTV